jgi:hypothetical protein
MLAPWRRLQRVANAVSAPSSEPPYQDETSAPADWRAHAPREEIRPAFGYSASTGSLMITTDERAGLNGSWARSVPVRGGETYEFTARLRPTNVPLPRRCAVTRVLWQDAEGGSVLCDEPGTAGPGRSDGSEAQTAGRSVAEPEYPVEDEPAVAGRWSAVRGTYRAPADATQAVIELSLRWATDARVEFADVELRAAAPPPRRLARLATAHFRPERGTTAAEKREQFVPLVEQAAAARADLLVLPETLTYYQAATFEDAAEPIPGPSTAFFGALAREHDMYIVAGLVEREGRLIYNTAALLGPESRAANSRGHARGSHRTSSHPIEDPWDPLQIGKVA